MRLVPRTNSDSKFGRRFELSVSDRVSYPPRISRNNYLVNNEKENLYYFDTDNFTLCLNDEQMEELFIAWRVMKQEYETGREVELEL